MGDLRAREYRRRDIASVLAHRKEDDVEVIAPEESCWCDCSRFIHLTDEMSSDSGLLGKGPLAQ